MKRLNAITLALAGALSACVSLAAYAHDDATLDAMKAPHGGQLRMAGAQHLELVLVKGSAAAKDNSVLVYVTDHAGTPVSTKGATGSITLLSGQNKITTALKPEGVNALRATARYASTPDIKAVVTVTIPGLDAQQARFTPLAPRAAAEEGHGGEGAARR